MVGGKHGNMTRSVIVLFLAVVAAHFALGCQTLSRKEKMTLLTEQYTAVRIYESTESPELGSAVMTDRWLLDCLRKNFAFSTTRIGEHEPMSHSILRISTVSGENIDIYYTERRWTYDVPWGTRATYPRTWYAFKDEEVAWRLERIFGQILFHPESLPYGKASLREYLANPTPVRPYMPPEP